MTPVQAELSRPPRAAAGGVQAFSRPHIPQSRTLLSLALAVVLWPALVHPPAPPLAALDPSWQEVLIHAHEHGWQFGTEVIFTYGPWGFLDSGFHLGATGATSKLIWEIGGRLLIALGLMRLTQQFSLGRQMAFALVCLLLMPIGFDSAYLMLIALAVIMLLLRPESRPWQIACSIAALAFLSQIKFTYLLLATMGILCAAGLRLARGESKAAAAKLAAFAAALAASWLAGGQHLENLPAYLRMSWEICQGYAPAMSLTERHRMFWAAIVVLSVIAALLVALFRSQPARSQSVAMVAYLSAATYLAWKHGFTRADGHVIGFFIFSSLLILVLVCLLDYTRRPWLFALPAVCLWGLHLAQVNIIDIPRAVGVRYRDNVSWILRAPSLPTQWQAELLAARQIHSSPAIVKTIGAATVDVFHNEQGFALLHGLNYSPRPVFQSYSAYTRKLAEANLRFYQSPRAPEFILFKQCILDRRYPSLDDAAILAELPRCYEPLFQEGEFLLLKKRGRVASIDATSRTLWEKQVSLGEKIVLPELPGDKLWLQVDLPASALGRLRAMLYKPPIMNLIATDADGKESAWRLVPQLARAGFLLQPLLEAPADFHAYLHGAPGRAVRSFRLEAGRREKPYWGQLHVRLSALSTQAAGTANRGPSRVQ